jgi:hypothetical protein
MVRKSNNERIGYLPPAYISNYNLMSKAIGKEFEIKPNLKFNVDYRGVNKRVWDILIKTYGGGPAIVRDSADIYSNNPFDEMLLNSKVNAYIKNKTLMINKPNNIFAKKMNGISSPRENSNMRGKRNLFKVDNE